MSSGERRLSEMIGIERPRPNTEAVWPTNVALACLGGAILWIAFRFLKWDDPRPLYNPWLYAIVAPVVLVLISLLLRQIVSRVVERSAQVAFLFSVMVHLVLLVYALDVVVYAHIWPSFFQALAEEKEKLIEKEHRAPRYFSGTLAASLAPGSKKPDYLRYIPTEHQATDTKLSDQSRLELAKNEKAEVTSPEIKPENKVEQPFLMEREKPQQSMSVSSEAPAELSRAEVALPSPSRSQAEAMDAVEQMTRAPELTAADTSSSRAPRGDSSSVPQAHALIEANSIGPSAPPLGLPTPKARSSDSPSSLAAANVPRPIMADMLADSDSPRSRTSSIPVPETLNTESSNRLGLAPALGSTGAQRRSTNSGSSIMTAPDGITLDGGLSGSGAGNLGSGSPLGRRGVPEGLAMGAGISQGSFALPRGELGTGSGPAGTGRIDVPDTLSVGAGLAGNTSLGLGPSSQSSGRRNSDGAGGGQIRLDVDAERGLGGISLESGSGPMVARNIPSAPALELPSLDLGRFSRESGGGPLGGGVTGAVPAPAFQQRIDRLKDETGDDGPIGPQTEAAIERGLQFLAKHQRPDGSWKLQDLDKDVLIHSDTAATGLCLLAFQGAGYTHKQYKYATVNDKALKFLIERQKSDGDLYIRQDPASDQNAWLYSHGIAALALCEAYGMTQDPELKGPAQLAVKFMIDSQEPQRGGWRYRPGVGSDTSVTGWFMMALKSAQLAGLEVPPSTFDRLGRYVEASKASAAQPHLFRYNPFAPDTVEQRHGLKPTHVMTSVGLLMRLYLGWQRELPEMQAGTDFLLTYLPEPGTAQATKRDTYYWYYATQVLFHMGGDRWKQWNDRLRPLLLDSQIMEGELAGSWDPYLPSSDLWARYGGRLYVTTLNLLSLEVHYRHLPLYEATAK